MNMPRRLQLICLVLVIGLYSCQIDDREPSYQEIPIYPNAQDVTKDPDTKPPRSIEFRSSSPVEDVEAFYQTELSKLGWQFEGKAHGQFLGYFNLNHNGSSNYQLVLRMSIGVDDNLETYVKITQLIAYQGQKIGLNP
jgi:hypothetical protein